MCQSGNKVCSSFLNRSVENKTSNLLVASQDLKKFEEDKIGQVREQTADRI